MRNVRQAAVPQVQLVTFRVGGEEYGLDVFQVHEILRYTEPTPMPKAPAFVEGVLDVRGSLVPVVDLRKRFELHEVPYDDDTRIILVDFQGERLGLIVDEVVGQLEIAIKSLGRYLKSIRGFGGVTILGDGRICLILDFSSLLEL